MEIQDVIAFRKSRGFTVSKMAREIGIVRQTLASMERGSSKLSDVVKNYVLKEKSRREEVGKIKKRIASTRLKMEEVDSLLNSIIQILEERE